MSDEKQVKNKTAAKNPKKEVPPKSENVRTFNVFVDGEYFKVEVDAIGGPPVVRYVQPPPVQAAAPAAPAAPVAPPEPAKPIPPKPVKPFVPSRPVPSAAPSKTASAKPKVAVDGVPIISPMPGTIIRYEKKVGESITEGETLVILEAMKMENALPAPASGKIKTINFKSGDSVAKDDVLCVIG